MPAGGVEVDGHGVDAGQKGSAVGAQNGCGKTQ